MNSNNLVSLPNSLFSIPALKFLDLSHNKLGTPSNPASYLSESIANAESLVELRLAGNQLAHLPKGIGSLSNLEILDLKDNQLAVLPDEIGCLYKLIKLNLDGNKLKVVPASIGNLSLLTDFSAAKNKIESVENECLVELKNLVMLDLHQNCLTHFGAIPKARKLDTICLNYNRLESI